ncbi:hypothetical protein C7974DRAFT_52683 [Boeremia exigua]|uniref:uncharacterized protein n=1 Tax=Boeremia exigua TaxID=749465 RepID=UPI001E8D2DB9|nr:uncharacterized protein C7974DRAFT_52683 [Boeremia exigua]KAH6616805.1 hypothetical protein C7974DRAFT_52683 [Boeremia exigua]
MQRLVNKGDRFINGYDQAYHLCLPLMNLRPNPQGQQPKRDPITYQCQHGIPVDWSDSKALAVANKGIQNAVRDSLKREDPWSEAEREELGGVFLKQPMISLLDAAQLFNDRAHPLKENVDRKRFYPIERFTESIQHEYRIYKTTCDEGRAPRMVATDANPAS